MKVAAYVVNLERSAVRRETVRAELEKAGITATFLPAVDAREVPEDYFDDRFEDFGPWGIVPRVNHAITQSHLNCLEAFIATDADLALVFEDDVFVAPELGKWLADLSWWPADADMVRFEVWDDPRMVHVLARRAKHFMGRRISRLFSRHPGAAGYMISRDHAARLLAVARISLSTDAYMFNPYVSEIARSAKIYQVDPGLVEQGNDPANEQIQRTTKKTANRAQLRRQAWNRGWVQLRHLPIHLWQLLSGQARLARLTTSLTPVETTSQLQAPT